MIDLNIALELMTDFAEEVYEILEGKYPRFVVEEWKDKVFISRSYIHGVLSLSLIHI